MVQAFRDPTIPSLDSFEALVKKSVFADVSDQLMAALRGFERDLNLEFTLEHFIKRFPELRRAFPVKVHRVFFNPALTYDRGIVITVFLEARPIELRERKRNYVVANKQLHHAFLSEDGIIRKDPAAFRRDREIAATTEHTAYAKFYLKKYFKEGKFAGLSILIHPIQKARLVYDPSKNPQYLKFKNRAEHLRRNVSSLAKKVAEEGEHPQRAADLQVISDLIVKIKSNVYKKGDDFSQSISELQQLVARMPSTSAFDVRTLTGKKLKRQDPKKSGGKKLKRPTTQVRKLLLRFVRDAIQVRNMYLKRGQEAHYHAADKYSGEFRESILMLAADDLKKRLEAAFHKPAYRFMLSARQIDRIRLVDERGNVRENIKLVPHFFETKGHRVVTTDTYPLQYVDSRGRVSRRVRKATISLVSLDQTRHVVDKRMVRRKRKQSRQARRKGRRGRR